MSRQFYYKFTGKLQPQTLIKDLNIDAQIYLKSDDFKIEGQVLVKVKRSNLIITYISSLNHIDGSSTNLETLKNFLKEATEMVINKYCYIYSIYLDVYLLRVRCPKLKLDYVFGIKGELNIEKSSTEANEEFRKLSRVFSTDNNTLENNRTYMKDVFSDFIKAIKFPPRTAQFCFSAIETIRTNYYDDKTSRNSESRRKKGWEVLKSDLKYTREDFEFIEDFATPNRHGTYPMITYEQREKIMNFTRELIDKFIENKLLNM